MIFFRCYELKYFKLIQLFIFYSVSIIDCLKTIYLQTFKTFTLYKSVQSKM